MGRIPIRKGENPKKRKTHFVRSVKHKDTDTKGQKKDSERCAFGVFHIERYILKFTLP